MFDGWEKQKRVRYRPDIEWMEYEKNKQAASPALSKSFASEMPKRLCSHSFLTPSSVIDLMLLARHDFFDGYCLFMLSLYTIQIKIWVIVHNMGGAREC